MTNEQLFEDLKQFIAATITQQTSDIREDIAQVKNGLTEVQYDVITLNSRVATIDSKIETLRQEMSDGFVGVGETIEVLHQRTDTLEADAHTRLTRLEHRAA